MTSQLSSPSPTPMTTTIDALRIAVSRYLDEYIARLRKDAASIDTRYDTLWRSIERLTTVGGKRIRPYIVAASYEAFSQQPFPDTLLPVASAQEVLHLAMLIHDDVIDRDDIRYGVRNVSGQYVVQYEDVLHDTNERRHFASSAAILAGDALLSQAHIMTSLAPVEGPVMTQLQQIVGDSVFEVIGGELLDTEAAFMPTADNHSLLISRYKTASYTFIGPLKIGALLAGASRQQLHTLEQIGTALGIGYQLRDDILGVFGDSVLTGKSTISDIREAKRTYLIEQFDQLATTDQQRDFKHYFGNAQLTQDELLVAKQLLVDSGARRATEAAIQHYGLQAKQGIDTLSLDKAWSEPLQSLISRSMDRQK